VTVYHREIGQLINQSINQSINQYSFIIRAWQNADRQLEKKYSKHEQLYKVLASELGLICVSI